MQDGWYADPLNKSIGSPDAMLDRYIATYNSCISKAPPDMHVGVHLCRGNYLGSRHFSSGSYDRIATKLFQHLNVHTYYLEFDTPRAGGFEPLEYLPKNKNVILGVVTSKFAELEDKEQMKERVYQAADIVAKGSGQTRETALQRLGVSPQCGFASHFIGNVVTVEDMEKKLRLVRAIADDVWGGEP
jgi:methionine synthase II (cobalamin-independent)